jgi:hypothetical protein
LTSDLASLYSYKGRSDATFNIYISHTQGALEKIHTLDLSVNRQVPNIYLGEVNIDLLPAIEGE